VQRALLLLARPSTAQDSAQLGAQRASRSASPPCLTPAQDKTTFASQMQSTLNGDLAKELAKELHSSMKLGAGPEREREAAFNPHLPPGAQEEQRQKNAAEQAMGNAAPRWGQCIPLQPGPALSRQAGPTTLPRPSPFPPPAFDAGGASARTWRTSSPRSERSSWSR
jgi:hypothetical protein